MNCDKDFKAFYEHLTRILYQMTYNHLYPCIKDYILVISNNCKHNLGKRDAVYLTTVPLSYKNMKMSVKRKKTPNGS